MMFGLGLHVTGPYIYDIFVFTYMFNLFDPYVVYVFSVHNFVIFVFGLIKCFSCIVNE